MRGSGTDGRGDLPAEHGFRFFPGFYRHLPDTMKRIPGPRAGHHVFDELVAADRMMLAREDGANELITAAHAPASLDDFAAVAQLHVHASARGWASRPRTRPSSSTGCWCC